MSTGRGITYALLADQRWASFAGLAWAFHIAVDRLLGLLREPIAGTAAAAAKARHRRGLTGPAVGVSLSCPRPVCGVGRCAALALG